MAHEGSLPDALRLAETFLSFKNINVKHQSEPNLLTMNPTAVSHGRRWNLHYKLKSISYDASPVDKHLFLDSKRSCKCGPQHLEINLSLKHDFTDSRLVRCQATRLIYIIQPRLACCLGVRPRRYASLYMAMSSPSSCEICLGGSHLTWIAS